MSTRPTDRTARSMVEVTDSQYPADPHRPQLPHPTQALERRTVTRRVSIITAAYAPKADYPDEAMRSVLAQEMPHRWEYEWLVQEDGTEPQLADKFADIPNVHYA